MENDFFKHLLTKISEGRASDDELLLYQKWYEQQLLEDIDEEEFTAVKAGVSSEIYSRLQSILDAEGTLEPNNIDGSFVGKSLWKRWVASVAAVLLIIGLGVYSVKNQQPIHIIQKEYKQVNFDTTEGVILKLANGNEIDLSSISSDSISQLTNKDVVKEGDMIQYDLSSTVQHSSGQGKQEEIFNTLYTPAGKTFQIVLADGTKVWLNAQSMLRFPINFLSDQRRVQLIGEGYFEVVSNSSKPFVVESQGQEVLVHGTKFNINAYNDVSAIKSTLFEGSVSVRNVSSNKTLNLLPGHQSVFSSSKFNKQKVLLKNVLGWKNGFFVFHNEKFGDICHSLSRWYNVEFDTSNNPKILNQVFSGTVAKLETVDDVLAVLAETSTFKYKRVGRRILIMN
ncbi:FecR family protein [Sphingobacterium bovistauri]|uniref:FecR family protein n=1 Tax=Sphingobacterium bovistauri TaxID=2781959 RepID=A0ABS7Z9T4_9SPHI|nr:FecR family protein [Sphingobacterium bovistauri]MCA5006347.1 FecR family protein [Sphingobacterium bovistauri]